MLKPYASLATHRHRLRAPPINKRTNIQLGSAYLRCLRKKRNLPQLRILIAPLQLVAEFDYQNEIPEYRNC
jgi:hypothetical protein